MASALCFLILSVENQGLLTYFPPFLLCDPSNCSQVEQMFISMVVVHEISHQWFGDTVTPEWYNTHKNNTTKIPVGGLPCI